MKYSFNSKIYRVLNFVLVLMLVLTFKIWHLCIIKNEEKIKEAAKPQTRTILERAQRGAIYDRNYRPLAINHICYKACIYYAHFRQIPTFALEKQGNQTLKKRPRKEYIRKLSEMLSEELNLNAERIEDLIYAKAALLPHVPFIIKDNLSEQQYYRLKILQKDFPGLQAEIASERFYPQGKTAADMIGHMGAISLYEYQKLAAEIQELEEEYLENIKEENNIFRKSSSSLKKILEKLEKLKNKAYQINDLVGKSGLEFFFEKELRGLHGKKNYAVDIQSNVLAEHPKQGKKAQEGKSFCSSIIIELQQYAEKLLQEDEHFRIGKSRYYDPKKQERIVQPQPAIKGGAIVVMDPKTADILTLATYPSFNPNNFASFPKNNLKKLKWLENPAYVQQVFDGKSNFFADNLTRKKLSWSLFTDLMALNNPALKAALKQAGTIKKASLIQEAMEELLYLASSQDAPLVLDLIFPEKKIPQTIETQKINRNLKKHSQELASIKNKLFAYCGNLKNCDKLFFIDLLRIALNSPIFSDGLLQKTGHFSLEKYWDFSKNIIFLKTELKKILKPLYHQIYFKKFKKRYQTDFLKTKREEEKEKKIYPKPYLEYLDQLENEFFTEFLEKNELLLLISWIKETLPQEFTLVPFYKKLMQAKHENNEEQNPENDSSHYFNLVKSLKEAEKNCQELNFELSYNLLKTVRSFHELERPLLGRYFFLRKSHLEKDLASCFYPQSGYGFMSSYAYKKSAPLGSIFKLVPAWTALKKQYLASHNKPKNSNLLNPFSMIDTRQDKLVVGYTLDRKPYPRYYKGGRLPGSSNRNMGQIDLISALEQSSNPYFAILAGDFLDSPYDLFDAAKQLSFGEKTGIELPHENSGCLPDDLAVNKTGLYSFAMGQHSFEATPLQTAVMLSAIANGGKVLKPKLIKEKPTEINRKILLPNPVRNMILEGVDKVLWGEKGSARPITILKLRDDPVLREEYKTLKHQLIGKTSTSEFMYKMGLSPSVKADKYKDIWFGGFSFKDASYQKPELVIVVYLRFGNAGREAAPIAAKIVQKYRELNQK